jgi:hypothetical protein
VLDFTALQSDVGQASIVFPCKVTLSRVNAGLKAADGSFRWTVGPAIKVRLLLSNSQQDQLLDGSTYPG